MKRLYFDYNASAPLAEGLVNQLAVWLSADDKNPNSVHADGQLARAKMEQARRELMQLLNAVKSDRLIFTSGGTESNNTVLRSAWKSAAGRKTLLLTPIEHSSTLNAARALEREGAILDWIEVDRSGQIDLQSVLHKMTNDVFLVSCMLANNETGFVLPVTEIGRLARQQNLPLHVDAVCAIGKVPVDVNKIDADFVTFSAHKYGALKGVGGIIWRQRSALESFISGGPQEFEKRAGTQNLHGILSSAFALRASLQDLASEIDRQNVLRNALKAGILNSFPRAVFQESQNNLSQTLNVAFPGLSGTVLLTNLDLEGVSVSHGSACASGSLEISHVLRAIGLPVTESSSALRFSFGRTTSASDIDELLRRLDVVLLRMQSEHNT